MKHQNALFALIKPLFFGVLLALSTVGCSSDDNGSTSAIEVTGIIQVQGITTYQYGTHVIANYAIRSNTINLDDFVNQSVTVIGNKIEGYPVDGGPDYLEVIEIK